MTNHWSTNDEVSTWVDVEDGLVIKVLHGDDCLNNLFHDIFTELGQCNLIAVLHRDNDGVNTDWDTGTMVKPIFAGDLKFKLKLNPGHFPDFSIN